MLQSLFRPRVDRLSSKSCLAKNVTGFESRRGLWCTAALSLSIEYTFTLWMQQAGVRPPASQWSTRVVFFFFFRYHRRIVGIFNGKVQIAGRKGISCMARGVKLPCAGLPVADIWSSSLMLDVVAVTSGKESWCSGVVRATTAFLCVGRRPLRQRGRKPADAVRSQINQLRPAKVMGRRKASVH